MNQVSTTEKLMFSTARIVGVKADGTSSTGTGFFFGFPNKQGRARILVTNKHVVHGVPTAQVLVHAFPKQETFPTKPSHKLAVNIPAKYWVLHPNPKVDLCATPFGDPDNPERLGSRLLFIGVLYSGPVIQADVKIVIRNIPTKAEPVAELRLMMNLGYAIKSKELTALVDAVAATF